MLCCPKGYHFINLKRKEKQVLGVILNILKQVLFILGVSEPIKHEMLTPLGQIYQKTEIVGGRDGKTSFSKDLYAI